MYTCSVACIRSAYHHLVSPRRVSLIVGAHFTRRTLYVPRDSPFLMLTGCHLSASDIELRSHYLEQGSATLRFAPAML
jgi:hypothetical protein